MSTSLPRSLSGDISGISEVSENKRVLDLEAWLKCNSGAYEQEAQHSATCKVRQLFANSLEVALLICDIGAFRISSSDCLTAAGVQH